MSLPAIIEGLNRDRVRKWGLQALFLDSPSAVVPAAFYNPTTLVPTIPATMRHLGFISTDGVSNEVNVSSEDTNMVQDLEPVRTDITGMTNRLTVTLGESSSALVNAVWHGVPFEDFPADPDGAWVFHDGEIADFPEYRLMGVYQDGVGDRARYRVEYGYRAKVIAKQNRTMNRSSFEGMGLTFGLFKDPVANRSVSRMENGPLFL